MSRKKIDIYIKTPNGLYVPNVNIQVYSLTGAFLGEYYTDKTGKAKVELPTDVGSRISITNKCIVPNNKFIYPEDVKNSKSMTIKTMPNKNCNESDFYDPNKNTSNQNTTRVNFDFSDVVKDFEDPYHVDINPGSQTNINQSNQINTSNQSTGNYQTGGIKPSNTGNSSDMKKYKFQIIDNKTNAPLSGAEVYNARTKEGTISDWEGFVTISANENDLIQIRYMGYKPIDVYAKNITNPMPMEEDVQTLDAVTITINKNNRKWWLLGLGIIAAKILFSGKKGMNGPVEVDL